MQLPCSDSAVFFPHVVVSTLALKLVSQVYCGIIFIFIFIVSTFFILLFSIQLIVLSGVKTELFLTQPYWLSLLLVSCFCRCLQIHWF